MSAGRAAVRAVRLPAERAGLLRPGRRRGDARARDAAAEIERRARRFEGAWSYLELIAESAGIADPLDAAGGRGVLGRQRPARPGRSGRAGGAAARPVPRPARRHLAGGGRPGRCRTTASRCSRSTRGRACSPRPATRPPLSVLDRCRIRTGVVTDVDGETATVGCRPLPGPRRLLHRGRPVVRGAGPVVQRRPVADRRAATRRPGGAALGLALRRGDRRAGHPHRDAGGPPAGRARTDPPAVRVGIPFLTPRGYRPA